MFCHSPTTTTATSALARKLDGLSELGFLVEPVGILGLVPREHVEQRGKHALYDGDAARVIDP